MRQVVIENPVINSPFDEPNRQSVANPLNTFLPLFSTCLPGEMLRRTLPSEIRKALHLENRGGIVGCTAFAA